MLQRERFDKELKRLKQVVVKFILKLNDDIAAVVGKLWVKTVQCTNESYKMEEAYL